MSISLGNLNLSPAITAGSGYDSSPNGAARGAAVLNFNPSLLLADEPLGFGAYAAAPAAFYPGQAIQNTAGYTLAMGERAVLPAHVLTLAFVRLRAQETGFALNTLPDSEPTPFTVMALRGADQFATGMLTLTPELSATQTRFPTLPGQDRTDYRQSLTAGFSDGGPARFVSRLQATESAYRTASFNADTYQALAGVADSAEALWNFRILAGMASRQPAAGKSLVAPVVEAAASWMPDDLDSLTFSLAHEIDNPGQETADGYTLTQAKFSIDHEHLRNIIISGATQLDHAVYFEGGLIETVFNVHAGIDWHVNRAIALSTDYAFNDRQANFRRAANEHIVTFNITWSP